MALINCIECGGQVSDKAASCPKCGHPVVDSISAHRKNDDALKADGSTGQDQPPPFSGNNASADEPPPFRRDGSAFASSGASNASASTFASFSTPQNKAKDESSKKWWIIGGSAAAAAVAGAMIIQANAVPKIIALENNTDESCSVLPLEYCVRVFCKFRNDGSASGFATVSASISNRLNGAFIAKKVSTVALEKGQTDIVSFDFPEAEVSDGMNYNTLCSTE